MKSNTIAIASAMLLALGTVRAMDVKVVSGDLNALKGEKVIKVEYVYEISKVGDMTEEAYIQKKTTDHNAKSPGKGDRWKEAWTADRARVYEPKFEDLFNKMLRDRKIDLRLDPKATGAKYTLIFKTTYMEPGFNVWITRGNAYIDAEVSFVETARKDNTVAKVDIRKSPGRNVTGDDYYESTRLGESYAKAGKELGILVAKKLK